LYAIIEFVQTGLWLWYSIHNILYFTDRPGERIGLPVRASIY